MRNTSIIAAGLLGLCFIAPLLPGEDICIPNPIKVDAVEGTVYFEAGGKREPLSDVIVEVAPYGYKKPPIANVVTKQDGRFSLSHVQAGRYYLSVRHAAVIGLSVEMRLRRSKEAKDGHNQIQIVLRNDPSLYCAGGTVSVVRKGCGDTVQALPFVEPRQPKTVSWVHPLMPSTTTTTVSAATRLPPLSTTASS